MIKCIYRFYLFSLFLLQIYELFFSVTESYLTRIFFPLWISNPLVVGATRCPNTL